MMIGRGIIISKMPVVINRYYSEILFCFDKIQNFRRLKKVFRQKMNYELNLKEPRSYNEKIQWKKIHDRNPLLAKTADKYQVRFYLKDVLGQKHADNILIPLYFVTDNPTKIPFEDLPDKFVIKPNHGSQMHMIVENKNQISPDQIIKECRKWLKINYGFFNYEWAYRRIKRKIIIEKLLATKEGGLPLDYKFFCFHGKCRLIRAQLNRFNKEVLSGYFDTDWNLIPVSRPGYKNTEYPFEKPSVLDDMIKTAEKISGSFDAVRIDLYNCDNKIYFGELTHYDFCGFARFEPESFDFQLGKYWNLKPGYWFGEKNS